jgi:hypothetical protein
MKLPLPLLLLATFNLQLATAATVTGNLTDISLSPLNTKLLFSPTNEVLLVPSGLSAGPPRAIDTVSGAFSVPLEGGDYTVSLPLIPWRRAFPISVPDTGATINITNLLSTPRTYIYTNRFIPPLHVNTAQVIALSTSGEVSLLTSSTTITANTLGAGNVITIEAFGSFADPASNIPHSTFKLKLGSTVIVTQAQDTTAANWHIRAVVTIRSAGPSGSAVGTIAVTHDNSGMSLFSCASQTATINTTISLAVALTAEITDFTGAENITCDQLIIHLE